MLTAGSEVLVDKLGARKPVQDLMIGERIYDRFFNRRIEITDILSREVAFDQDAALHHPLYPVQLTSREGDILVSPRQQVLCAGKTPDCSYASLEMHEARGLTRESDPAIRQITYYAVFSDVAGYLDVSGWLFRTLTNDIFHPTPPDRAPLPASRSQSIVAGR